MTVYVIADIKVTEDGWIPAYAASVHELVHKHGGKYLSRSGNVKTLEGKPLDGTFIALLEFPSASTKTRPTSSSTSMRSAAGIETHMDEPRPTVENAIEVRIEEISQLFHSLDPFPFRERDLDQEAEEFIVGWARELSFDCRSRSSCICRRRRHLRLRPARPGQPSRDISNIAPG
jgi:uncharacterized protein (DUF1330 family)